MTSHATPLPHSFRLFAASLVCLCLSWASVPAEPTYLWIEAESFTSATSAVRIVEQLRGRPHPLGEDTAFFLARSGWDLEANQRVSGGAFIEQTAGERKAPDPSQKASYEVHLPADADYRLWVRCDSPPPCTRYFRLWFDSESPPPDEVMALGFSYWNVWSWWPWGGRENTGAARPIPLRRGKHTLWIGDMHLGLKIDKFLLTDDPDYTPFGTNQQYYNGSFEPLQVKGAHPDLDKALEPSATGWMPVPSDRWSIRKEAVTGNHYYHVAPPHQAARESGPAYALIRNLECEGFRASFRVVFSQSAGVSEPDALLVYGVADKVPLESIRFLKDIVQLVRFRGGEPLVVHEAPLPSVSGTVTVVRERAGICVRVHSAPVLDVRLPAPPRGSIGIGSYSGGIGFDDVEITLTDDPGATFDFTAAADPARADWLVRRGDGSEVLRPTDRLEKSETAVYNVPFWSNGAVRVVPLDSFDGRLSLLYPYRNAAQRIETELTVGQNVFVRVRRRFKGEDTLLGAASAERTLGAALPALTVQSAKGLFAVFLDGVRVIQANEYDLLSGTVAVRCPDGAEHFPLRTLQIERKQVVFDTFPLDGTGRPAPDWDTTDGNWRVIPSSDDAGDDGQLVVQGPATALVGEANWRNCVMEVSAQLDGTSEIALAARDDGSSSLELHCRGETLRIRKVSGGQAIVLATADVPGLSEGWHRIGFVLDDTHAVGEIDGEERVRTALAPSAGRAGLRNYGEYAAFDDVTIHVVAVEPPRPTTPLRLDPLLSEIEDALLE